MSGMRSKRAKDEERGVEAEKELEEAVEPNRGFFAGGGAVPLMRELGGEAEGVTR